MPYWSVIFAKLIKSCQLLSIGMLIITVFWLVKQINVITKLTRNTPQMVVQATQTTNHQTSVGDTDTNLLNSGGKKRRSHRNGKKEYLRKWPEQ